MTISISQAFAQWEDAVKESGVDTSDSVAMSESWNDYIDSLCKDGSITNLQYHYAPAYDEEMPGNGSRFDELSDDRDFILDKMGVFINAHRSNKTREGWNADASHWRVTVCRGETRFIVDYSMGSAHKGEPKRCDVVNCVLMDSSYADCDFDDFVKETGCEMSTREQRQRTRNSYNACQKSAENLQFMFSGSELEDLRELFADM